MTSIEGGADRLLHIARTGRRLVLTRGVTILIVASTGCLLTIELAAPDHRHGVAIMATAFVASLVSSVAGFAFSALAGGILFHLQADAVRIVAILITCSIANQLAMTWAIRRDVDWVGLSNYLAGGAAGLWIGIWILIHASRFLYTHLLGCFLLAYGITMLRRRAIVVCRPPLIADVCAGFLGGVTGGAAAFPGAFLSIWCGMKGWDKARQRAVIQPYILIMQIAGLFATSLTQRSQGGRAAGNPHDLIFIPASLLGTSIGLALYGRLTDVQFSRVVNLLLIVSGLTFIL